MRSIRLFIILLFLHAGGFFAQKLQLEFEKPEFLSPEINSEAEETMPLMSPKRTTIFFVRAFHPENTGEMKGGQDIWLITENPDKSWSKPYNIGKPLNTFANNAIVGFSKDGTTIYLQNTYDDQKEIKPGLSYSYRTEMGWTIPEPIEIPALLEVKSSFGLYMCPDEKTLLISMDGPGSIGEEDLYVSFKKSDGWTEPLNLGPQINTDGFEISPFAMYDNKVLFFATNGRKGFGDADIFVSFRLDNSWQKWSKPENLGNKINSEAFDAYLSVNDSNDVLFASSRNTELCELYLSKIISSNLSDLVKIAEKQEVAKKDSTAPMTSKLPIAAKSVNSHTVKTTSGKDSVVVDSTVTAQLPGLKETLQDSIKKEKEIDREQVFVTRRPMQDKDVPPIEMIFFAFNSYTIMKSEYPTLDRISDMLLKDPGLKVELWGHSDALGPDDVNLIYSEKRAFFVKAYLAGKGISVDRFTIFAYGKTQPLESNATPEGRRKNRRVEVVFRRK